LRDLLRGDKARFEMIIVKTKTPKI
jgi:hypothetical protein